MGVDVEVKEGTTILDAAVDNNMKIDHNCGGDCTCSTCQVIIEESPGKLDEMSEDEMGLLDEVEALTETCRLACPGEVKSDLVVRIQEKESEWENDTL